MNPGNETVTFVTIAPGAISDLGVPAKVRTLIDVAGCSMQPVDVREAVTTTDVATEVWRCIAPPAAAALTVTAAGELIFNHRTYQVTGAKPFSDLSGTVDHVSVICKIQVG